MYQRLQIFFSEVTFRNFLLHFTAWFVYYIMQFVWRLDDYSFYELLLAAIQVGSWAGIFYLGRFYLYPKYLNKNHWKLSIWLLLIFIPYMTYTYGLFHFITNNLEHKTDAPFTTYLRRGFFWYFNMNAVALGFCYFDQLGEEKREKEEIQKVLKEAELENLKSQFNPHFIFNTLWYVHVLISDTNEKATKAIEYLSSMMQYTMNSRRADEFVELDEELKYVEKFIGLQTLRNPKIQLDYQVFGSTKGVFILPLIIISFIENAFKHGVWIDLENPLTCHTSIDKATVTFLIKNKISTGSKEISSGIGLENVKRRLAGIYKNKYQLDVSNEANIYQTKLIIPIKTTANYE